MRAIYSSESGWKIGRCWLQSNTSRACDSTTPFQMRRSRLSRSTQLTLTWTANPRTVKCGDAAGKRSLYFFALAIIIPPCFEGRCLRWFALLVIWYSAHLLPVFLCERIRRSVLPTGNARRHLYCCRLCASLMVGWPILVGNRIASW